MTLQLSIPIHQPPPMSREERVVWANLWTRVGRPRAASSRDLEEWTGLSGAKIREVVNALVVEHGKLIGSASSAPAGYYVVETPEEAEAAAAHLRSRAMKMLVRASRLKRTSLDEVYGQGLLELERGTI